MKVRVSALDLSRFRAAPIAHLSDLSFEGQGAFQPSVECLRGDVLQPPSIDPSSLTRWRKRIGEEGVEWLLTNTIEAGRAAGAIKKKSVDKVIVDREPKKKSTCGAVFPTNGDGELRGGA